MKDEGVYCNICVHNPRIIPNNFFPPGWKLNITTCGWINSPGVEESTLTYKALQKNKVTLFYRIIFI